MNATCIQIARTQTTRFIDFGLTDAKGRKLGCAVIRREMTYAPAPEGQTWGTLIEPGEYVRIEVQTARDGKLFGATQAGRIFKKGEDAAILAYTNHRIVSCTMATQKKYA